MTIQVVYEPNGICKKGCEVGICMQISIYDELPVFCLFMIHICFGGDSGSLLYWSKLMLKA